MPWPLQRFIRAILKKASHKGYHCHQSNRPDIIRALRHGEKGYKLAQDALRCGSDADSLGPK